MKCYACVDPHAFDEWFAWRQSAADVVSRYSCCVQSTAAAAGRGEQRARSADSRHTSSNGAWRTVVDHEDTEADDTGAAQHSTVSPSVTSCMSCDYIANSLFPKNLQNWSTYRIPGWVMIILFVKMQKLINCRLCLGAGCIVLIGSI